MSHNKAFSLIELAVVIIAVSLIVVVFSAGKKLIGQSSNLVALNQADNDWEAVVGEPEIAEEEIEEGALPVTNGLAFWLDASDADSITDSAGAVSQWNDKSGGGNHAIQATGANQPITNSTTLNSLNVVDFDGSNDFLDSNFQFSITQDYTVFAIGVNTGTANFRGMFTQWDPGVNVIYIGTTNANLYYAGFHTGSLSSGVSTQSSTVAVINRLEYHNGDSPNNYYYINNSLVGSGDGNPDDPGSATVKIGRFNSGSYFWQGPIAEILVYSRILNASEITQVETYLGDRWGIN